MTHFLKAAIVGATLFVAGCSMATAAMAQTFDGEWRVQIAASSSACGDGSSVSININNGQVASSNMGVSASGQVGGAGNINVVLVSGARRAAGSGRLSATSGSGTWRGMTCSGTWTAQRN